MTRKRNSGTNASKATVGAGKRLTVDRWKSAPRDGESEPQGLEVESFGWAALSELEPQALGMTFWFEPSADADQGPRTIRFAGRRTGVSGKPGPRDHFTVNETIEDVVPGGGLVSVTTRVRDVTPGRWQVTATEVNGGTRSSRQASRRGSGRTSQSSGTTAFARALQVRAPGTHLGVWPALVGLGALVGLIAQAFVAQHLGLPVAQVIVVSFAACLVGLVGAKLYYATGHFVQGDRGLFALLSGACIQGFVIGAAVTLVVGAQLEHIAIGPLLDATAPALLFGMAIGRYGCFFGGCCVGRPTASRWGLWSSDRRLGMRRVPVQLLESTVALVLGIASLLAAWTLAPFGGAVFVGAMAAYTLGRQILFPLRAGARHTAYGRKVTMAIAALALVADIGFVLAQ